jgi:hypothetical protein
LPPSIRPDDLTGPAPPAATPGTDPVAPPPAPGNIVPKDQSPIGVPVTPQGPDDVAPQSPVPETQAEDLLPQVPGPEGVAPAVPTSPTDAPAPAVPEVPAAPDILAEPIAADGMPAQPGDVVQVPGYGVEETNPEWDPGTQQSRPRPEPETHGAETAQASSSAPAPPGAAPAQQAPEAQPAAPAAAGQPAAAHERRDEHVHHHEHHHRERHERTETTIIEVDSADLDNAGSDLRRWAAELQSIAAGLGTVRAGFGVSSIQQLVDETVGRQAAELEAVAAELLDEATELSMRAQIARDEVESALGPAAPPPTPADAPGAADAPGGVAPAADAGRLVGELFDALSGDDDERTS